MKCIFSSTPQCTDMLSIRQEMLVHNVKFYLQRTYLKLNFVFYFQTMRQCLLSRKTQVSEVAIKVIQDPRIAVMRALSKLKSHKTVCSLVVDSGLMDRRLTYMAAYGTIPTYGGTWNVTSTPAGGLSWTTSSPWNCSELLYHPLTAPASLTGPSHHLGFRPSSNCSLLKCSPSAPGLVSVPAFVISVLLSLLPRLVANHLLLANNSLH